MTAPTDPRAGRQDALIVFLRGAGAFVLVSAAATLVWGGEREILGRLLVVTLVIAPLSRVAWIATRWLRKGDYWYAVAALGLLSMIATAALVLR